MNESSETLLRNHNTISIDTSLITDVLVITLIWCVSVSIVNPIGNFPLNDDWSYGLTVKHLLETGDYRPLGWTSMTLITNVIWGSLFCLPTGFSFTALRLSTLVAAWLGLMGSYVLVRDMQQPRWLAFLVTLTLALNPIYYALSHTFMTDVLYTAIVAWAAVFLARSLKSSSSLQMLAGTALAVAATLSRQFALCIPLAFAITLVMRRGFTVRTVLRALVPLVVCIGAFLTFNYWLSVNGRLPALYGAQSSTVLQGLMDIKRFTMRLFAHTSIVLVYLGLFLLPVLLVSTAHLFRSHGKRAVLPIVGGILIFLGGLIVLVHYGYEILLPTPIPGVTFPEFARMPVPIGGNIFVESGIGPLTVRDTFVLKLDHVAALPTGIWTVVTAIGIVGSVLLIVNLGIHARNLISNGLRRDQAGDTEAVDFLILCGTIYVLLLIVADLVFDRYFVPSIPFFATGIVGLSGKFAKSSFNLIKSLRIMAFALLAAFSFYSIGGTRDYLEWNRVRWMALRDLMDNDHISADEIDGGFEFNGLHSYDPHYKIDFSSERSWWWVDRDTYQIGFGPVPGYRVLKEYSYNKWLLPHMQKVVVLQKE